MVTRYAPHVDDAVDRAQKQVGDRYPRGWCLRWAASVFGVPGVGDWDHDKANDAEDFWKAAVAKGEVVQTSDPKKIPAGSMVMWTGGRNDHGHAAIAIGNGRMISTDLPSMDRIGEVDIDLVRERWGLKLVGAILVDGNGYILKKKPGPKALKRYKVTAEGGLRARLSPSTSAPTKFVLAEGKVVAVKELVQRGRDIWAVVKHGKDDVYFHTAYLERV